MQTAEVRGIFGRGALIGVAQTLAGGARKEDSYP